MVLLAVVRRHEVAHHLVHELHVLRRDPPRAQRRLAAVNRALHLLHLLAHLLALHLRLRLHLLIEQQLVVRELRLVRGFDRVLRAADVLDVHVPRAVLHRLRLLLQLLHEEAGEAADERRHGVVLLSALQHGERAQQQLQEERLEEKALVLRLLLQRPVHDARHRLVDRRLLLRHHLERVLREIAQILVHGTVVAEEPILALQHVAERQEQAQAVLNGRHGTAHGVDHVAILAVGVEERLLEAVVAALEGDPLLLQRLHVAARSALVAACFDHERALLHLLPQRAHKTRDLAHLARQQ